MLLCHRKACRAPRNRQMQPWTFPDFQIDNNSRPACPAFWLRSLTDQGNMETPKAPFWPSYARHSLTNLYVSTVLSQLPPLARQPISAGRREHRRRFSILRGRGKWLRLNRFYSLLAIALSVTMSTSSLSGFKCPGNDCNSTTMFIL